MKLRMQMQTIQEKRLNKLKKERDALVEIIAKGEKRLKVEEKNTRNLKTGMKEAERARGKFDQLADSAARFGANVASAGNHIRQGFNAALRNSVAISTAFFYKINQNTQALIEFERELLNANSVFNLSNSNLFDVGNTIVVFGQRFGMDCTNLHRLV